MKFPSAAMCLCILLSSLFSLHADAGKWRVNNAGIQAHFTSLQEAASSASVGAGDTLYVEGSASSYGNLDLTKRLVIIGPGYFLGQNPETQANLVPAIIEYLTFNTGSKGSVMTGMTVNSWTTVQDTAITLVRNNFAAMNVYNPSINNNISQNVIYSLNISGSQGNNISNNLFTKSDAYYCGCFTMGNNSSGTVRHNIFSGCHTVMDCLFENNIATGTTSAGNNLFSATASTVNNNIGASAQYGTANGNQENVDMATVFLGTGSNDGKYQLQSGSPASGAGAGGADCGMFGGSAPYVLSGIPNLPAVGYININGTTVTVKARSH